MAANRFATMLHRKTNRITVILVYAVLEWILILLLFSSSLLSHLIIKFAKFFGLKPPCLWCTRIDHIFDSSDGNKNLHRDLLCEAHAKQVSRFGFCSIHCKLAESQDMCNDCLFSMPEFACFSGIKDFGLTRNDEMYGKQTTKCSCCGMSLFCRRTSSLDDLVYTHVSKEGDDGFDYLEGGDSDEKTQVHEDENVKKIDNFLKVEECVHVFEESSCNQHLEYFLDHTGHNLVPVELVKDEEIMYIKCDYKAENQECISVFDPEVEKKEALADDNGRFMDHGVDNEHKDAISEALADDNGRFIDLGVDNEPKDKVLEVVDDSGKFIDLGVDNEPKDKVLEVIDDIGKFIDLGVDNEPKDAVSESIVIEEDENSLVFQAKESLVNHCEALNTFSLGHWPSVDASDVRETVDAVELKLLDSLTEDAESEEAAHVHNENEAVVSIGTEIPELDVSDELQIKESVHKHECNHEDNLSEIEAVQEVEMLASRVREIELQPLSFDHNASFNLETQENEEDKVPDTPASLDSFHFFEKRDSWAEESFDGSVTSELDLGDGVVTIESLISALKAERKALKILYTEFEEERSASAVAANQTMAMINRLQEEKAAMQMEALQYLRMMEEQVEYDQDALQLMNELMVKRENEKRELEEELEECRKKIFDYETKERSKLLRNGFFSSPSINETGTQELGEDTASHDEVIETNEPLLDFDHERLSILEQLSVLEEKLYTVNDATDLHSVHTVDAHLITTSDNGVVHANGSLDNTVESKQHHKRIGFGSTGHKGKSLLPLLDAISDDQMVRSNGVHSTEQDYEEEICHLYERLETLEADKEILKQCISSMKQGDKELVHEILHSLRVLRNVELQARTRQPQDYCW